MESDVEACPRCAGKHDKLKFKPLARPTPAANFWATCPSSKEPILARVALTVVEPEAADQPDRPG